MHKAHRQLSLHWCRCVGTNRLQFLVKLFISLFLLIRGLDTTSAGHTSSHDEKDPLEYNTLRKIKTRRKLEGDAEWRAEIMVLLTSE